MQLMVRDSLKQELFGQQDSPINENDFTIIQLVNMIVSLLLFVLSTVCFLKEVLLFSFRVC